MQQNIKNSILMALITIPLILLFAIKGPIPQDQSYHQFIDQIKMLGIPNFHNVFSNLGFIIVGFIAFKDYFNNKDQYSISWLAFFIGIMLVGPGSAYYHFAPTDSTLVWDRLPMTIGFMGLISSIFTEIFNIKNEKIFLTVLLALGFYSVIHWILFDDLRVYGWVQFSTIGAMLFVAIFYNSKSINMKNLILAVIFYSLAKITEIKDAQIYDLLSYSGHSIKHLLAAIAVYFLILMKRKSIYAFK